MLECGILFGVVALFAQDPGDSCRIPSAVGILAAGVMAAAISLARNNIKVNKIKKMIDTAVQKNKPVIEWQAVQYLLDEQ